MINFVVAMTRSRVIGRSGKLPWHIPSEVKFFKELTSGGVVIMGRKTFDSIGKPLPGRVNIVLSRSMPPKEGIAICRSFDDALAMARSFNKEIFVIGGSSIYALALRLADRMYISYIKKDYEGDVFFPEFDETGWVVESKQDFPEFELIIYKKK